MKRGKPRKLNQTEELALYNAKKEGCWIVELAYEYGISIRTINRIVRRVEEESGLNKQQ